MNAAPSLALAAEHLERTRPLAHTRPPRPLTLEGAMLGAALESITMPAWIVASDGNVVHDNVAARALGLGGALYATLHAAVAGRCDGDYVVTPIRVGAYPTHHLVVARNDEDPLRARLARAIAIWSLTRRQAEVLALVARGDTNKDVAQKLDCTLKTVEAHIATLRRLARCDNRAALVATFWTLD